MSTPIPPRRFVAALVLALALAGCEAATAAAPVAATEPAAPAAPGTSTASGSPLVELAAPIAGEREFDGIVRERLAAGTYVYLAIESDRRVRWVATTGSSAAIGTTVHVQSMGTRRDFHSRRLHRRFDELVFGVVVPAANPERTPT